MQKGNYEGGRPSLWLKSEDTARGSLLAADTDRFFIPPFVGHKGWMSVYLDGPRPDWSLVAALVQESYRLIAPRRLAALVGGAERVASRPADGLLLRPSLDAARGRAPSVAFSGWARWIAASGRMTVQ